MANAEHLHSAGSSLGYSTTNSGYTLLTDLKKVHAPPLDRNDSKDTSLDSANMFEQSTPGWRKVGAATFEVYLTRAQFAALQTIYNLNSISAVYYWQLTVPKLSTESAASNLVWQGYVKTLALSEGSTDTDDKYAVTVTITGSYGYTWTQGS